ncbi:MAG: TonB family protein [Acidobacteriota bacterium]
MSTLALGNFWAWAIQVAAIAAVGLLLPVVARITSPRARLVYLRGLLLACLVLPFVQPWVPLPAPLPAPGVAWSVNLESPLENAGAVEIMPAVSPAAAATEQPVWPWTIEQTLLGVAVAGAAARVAWLGLGLWSLGRLRRRGRPLHPMPEPVEDARLAVGASADVLVSDMVARPVTFGFRRPAVIVPEEYRDLAPDEQRTIAMHELLHVRRRDWVRTLGDEIVRAVLWFHPAIWWLIDQIHLGIEQVVDREVVRLSGARRPYLEALLKMAASRPVPLLHPASMFLKQRHLAHRVASLVKEASMSRIRLAASLTVVGVLLVTSGYFVVQAFPLRTMFEPVVLPEVPQQMAYVAAPAPPPPPPPPAAKEGPGQALEAVGAPDHGSVAAGQQTKPVVDPKLQAPRPGMTTPAPVPPGPPKPDEATLRARIQANPGDQSWYFALAKLLEDQKRYDEAEQVWLQARSAGTDTVKALLQLAGFYNRRGDFERCVAALRERADFEPGNPEAHYTIATYYWDKAYRDSALSGEDKTAFVESGLAAVDTALQLKPDYMEALTYKNLLLRLKANLASDPAAVQALIAEADRYRQQAIDIRNRLFPVPANAVRIGGTIGPPTKVKDVRPEYPAEAAAANVAGVVIIEAVIGEDGRVSASRVLRSIPLLDQAAMNAVRQWEFTPTLLNGVPVPVVMTVTVNFVSSSGSGGLAEAAALPPPPPPPPPPAGASGSGTYRPYPYTGSPVTMDFTNADLGVVLRAFERISRMTIVGDPQALAKANSPLVVQKATFKETPWDQALEVILRSHQLGYVIEGNTIRLVPLYELSPGVGGAVGGRAQNAAGALAAARAASGAGTGGTPASPPPTDTTDPWYPLNVLRVGGSVRPPTKIVDVRAAYPEDAKNAGVQGVVIIEAVIGTDGKVSQARVLRSIPMLDQAALDAVQQWQFTPTMLNGMLVPVVMTVTVNFTLQ